MKDTTMSRRHNTSRRDDGRDDVAVVFLLRGRYFALGWDRFRIIRGLLAPCGVEVVDVDAADKVQAKAYGPAPA